MFDFIFNALFTLNVIALAFGGLLFLAIGGAILFDFFQWRAKGKRQMAKIAAVRVTRKANEDGEPFPDHKPEETQTPQKEGSLVGGVLFVLFITAFTGAFVAFGVYSLAGYIGLKQDGMAVAGEVIDYKISHDGEGGTSYYPVVLFRDQSGKSYELKSDMGSGRKKYEVGESVPVLYDPKDPEHFVVDEFWPNVLFPSAFIVMGSLVWLAFMFGGKAQKEQKPGPEKTRPGKRRKTNYAQETYHAVVEYTAPNGEIIQCETGVSSSSIAGKIPGTRLPVLTREDKPGDVRRMHWGGFILGVVLAVLGVVFLVVAARMFEFSAGSAAMLAGAFTFAAYKISKSVKPRKLRESKDAFQTRMREKRDKKRLAGVVLEPHEVRARQAYHQRMARMWAPVWFLIALGLMGGGYYLGDDLLWLEKNGSRAPGTVTRVESVSNSDGGYTYYPVVRFENNGERVEFRSRSGSNPPMHKRGDDVMVLYDPSKAHNTARIDSGWMNWLLPGGLFAAGLILLLLLIKQSVHLRRKAI